MLTNGNKPRISPIYKSDDIRYPISILPMISKVFGKEVFGQIYRYRYNFQPGFRPKYTTVSALILVCDEWLENMDDGKLTGVIFLDIWKAFDSINHKILLKKMKDQFGISGFELKRFESYLTNREQLSVFCWWPNIIWKK